MNELISVFRNLNRLGRSPSSTSSTDLKKQDISLNKRPKTDIADLDCIEDEATSASSSQRSPLSRRKFKLKLPRLTSPTSPTQKRIVCKKRKNSGKCMSCGVINNSGSTKAAAAAAVGGHMEAGFCDRCRHVSSGAFAKCNNGRPAGPFEDEDDLYAGRAGLTTSSSPDEDAGVYMQSSTSSSSSPAASQKMVANNRSCGQSSRPASCTFGNSTNNRHFAKDNFLSQGMMVQSPSSRASSACSMMSILTDQSGNSCPICRSRYDSSKKRKLVDSNCGHSRCFECMFQTDTCPLCSSSNNGVPSEASQIGNVKMRRGPSTSTTTNINNGTKGHSCLSRESGFQSFNGSVSSVYSGLQGFNCDQLDVDRMSDSGSMISLMSAQSSATIFMPAPPSRNSMYESPQSLLSRNDQKRHSLTSLGRYQQSGMGARNSFVRRSAIIPRNTRRLMTSIVEHQPLADSISTDDWPLKPIYFEVPTSSTTENKFVGRKWLFREILEHLSSDLPTSGGMIIQGAQATGKTSIIQRLVQGSCFGQQAPSMTSCIDILARDVAAYHFCQLDNEATCTIPEFVHSVAAQMSQAPQMSAYRQLIQSSDHLKSLLSYQSCVSNSSAAFIQGILEPLTLLKSQCKLPGQRCLVLIDGLCEAEYHRTDNGETLTTFLLAHLPRFPRWLRLICTVRTNTMDIVKPFSFHRLSLDNLHVDERLYKDVQDLVFQRIRESKDIQKNITPLSAKAEDTPQTSFAHYVIQSSGGNFLYCNFVLNLFQDGKLQVKSSSFSMVPLSLSEVYLLAFNIQFPTLESFGRAKDILSICVASLRPLTSKQIFDCANALKTSDDILTWQDFSDRFSDLSWLLSVRGDGTVMFFHSSVRDWLIGRRTTTDTQKFLCDPRDGHAAIALYLSRCQAPLDPDQTLELGHHLLKANLFRIGNRQGMSAKDLQATWITLASADPSRALALGKNISSPNVKVSRLLLLSGASPDSQVDGVALVNLFASRGNVDMLKLLAEFGANVNQADSQGSTALMSACLHGNLDIVELLVKAGAALNATDSKGSTALVYAAGKGHVQVVQYLLSCDWPTAGCSLEVTSQEALVIASKEGNLDVLEPLLTIAKVNGQCELSGQTALCTAAMAGKVDSCKMILHHGADVKLANRDCKTPLTLAVAEGHYGVVDLLLNSGANVDDCVNNKSPLAVAASEGQVGVMELLLARQADKELVDAQGLSPLAWAVIKGQTRSLDLLVKAGANVNCKDAHQRSPLHHAVILGNKVQIAQMLLDNGATIEEVDKDGIRPIDRAIGHGNEATVSVLLKKGAKLGPTTWAMAKGKPRIALILLNKLLEDGNTLFRHGRLEDAAYRYEYALRRLPRLRLDSGQFKSAQDEEDIFSQLKSHLLLNLSRTKRKMGQFGEAESSAGQVLAFRPKCHEAFWARAKARTETGQLQEALADLREALTIAPHNIQLHQFSLQVKNQLEEKAKRIECSENSV